MRLNPKAFIMCLNTPKPESLIMCLNTQASTLNRMVSRDHVLCGRWGREVKLDDGGVKLGRFVQGLWLVSSASFEIGSQGVKLKNRF